MERLFKSANSSAETLDGEPNVINNYSIIEQDAREYNAKHSSTGQQFHQKGIMKTPVKMNHGETERESNSSLTPAQPRSSNTEFKFNQQQKNTLEIQMATNSYQKRNAAQLDKGAAFKSSGITVSNSNYF